VFSDIDVLDAGLLKSYANQIAQGAVFSSLLRGLAEQDRGKSPRAQRRGVYVTESRSGGGHHRSWNGPTWCFVSSPPHWPVATRCAQAGEQTPMAAVLMARSACSRHPPGVVNVLQGTGELIGAGSSRIPTWTRSRSRARSRPGA